MMTMRNVTIAAILVHIVAAFFSTGFHHFDEHYQILEFLNWRLGNSPAGDLPWEFEEQLRPWSQVFFYYVIHNIFTPLGVKSPFVFAFIFRLVTSLIGLWSLYAILPVFTKRFGEQKEKWLLATWMVINFSWFVPYIQTRTSAESLSLSLFLFGTALFLRDGQQLKRNGLWAGLLFGLSFSCRYQMAVMVAPLWFWRLIRKDRNLGVLSLTALGIVFAIGVGLLADRWGNGEWVLSPWNYFYINIAEDKTSYFGVNPWWSYFTFSLKQGVPPVSIPFIVGTLYFWARHYSNPFTWVCVPYFIVHTMIGHKELRFIFPVVILSPFFLMVLLYDYQEKIKVLWEKRSVRGVVKFLVVLNLIVLLGKSMTSAKSTVNFYRYIYNSDISELYTLTKTPYSMQKLPVNYYKKKGFNVLKVDSVESVDFSTPKYLFFEKGKFIFEMEKREGCELLYLNYPKWTLSFNVGNWISRSRVWSLFKCHTP